MKKSHKAYLRRIIGRAIAERNHEFLADDILQIKTSDTVIHRIVRDIVCDSRFYSVLDRDEFWKSYATYVIGSFVDSISPEEWSHEEVATLRKEEFLTDWMSSHMIPISRDRRKEIEAEIKLRLNEGSKEGMPDPDDHDGSSLGEISLGDGIKDATNRTGTLAEGLPQNLKDFMEDAYGGNSPGLVNDPHCAEARFMARLHPSIVRLAEIIGRRAATECNLEKKGKFGNASKSDISGVSVGNDLRSLLPSELALLSTPELENVFLDRFARNKLQVFSSVSKSNREFKDKGGPIFICIDTSGSMVGEPEEMAKTLALAIAVIAQKEERTVGIFNYSFGLSFFILKNIKAQLNKLMLFLSESYGGGNDENRLIRFIFKRMPRMKRYKDFAGEMHGADMLVISDFRWVGLEPPQTELLLKARKKGMRIFSVGVNMDPQMSMYCGNAEEDYSGHLSGHRFFSMSDFRFRFEEGMIKEYRR